MTDPITDMFVRIKNAGAVNKKTVNIPFSKLKQEIVTVLKNTNFIESFEKKGRGTNKRIEVTLKYDQETPVISDFKRISSPGQRIYKGWRQIYPIKGGYGICIISTSKGVLVDGEVRTKKLGGEIMVEVW